MVRRLGFCMTLGCLASLLLSCSELDGGSDDGGTDAGSVDAGPPPPSMPAPEPYVDLVDPFLGTGGSGYNDIGSTFPGPQRPFGMVRPGPDTMAEGGAPSFTHCVGFAYSDQYITAFSHTRMHGVGIWDYGHLGVMPVPSMAPEFVTREGHRSAFSDASASPGYYGVTLERGSIRAELSATERVASHRYTYEAGAPQAVLFDVGHRLADGMTVADGQIAVDSVAREVTGFVRVRGAYSGRFDGVRIYFVAHFDRAFVSFGTWDGDAMTPSATDATGPSTGAWVTFAPAESEVVNVEIAVSFVDLAGAHSNLTAESTDFDFDRVRSEASQAWEAALGRVRIDGRDARDFRMFYTALYHSLLMPTLASDADGRYRGIDGAVHPALGHNYYTDFSLWDTYRTLHPLIALLYPEYQTDMLGSLAQMSIDGGAMPRWPLGHGYTGGMLGEPAAIVMADSWAKGLTDFDLRASYDAMRRSAVGPASPTFGGRGDAEEYERLGFVPVEAGGWSTSKTMEFAYADYALAQLATALDETDDATWLTGRSGNWRTQWDPAREFFVGRHEDGSFVTEFAEDRWQDFYSEGNAWQYLWLVPHDLDGLAEQLGGRDVMLSRLTTFFEESERERRTPLPPVWYWHGNEPDIHASYIFSAMGAPEASARWTRWVARSSYGEGPTGLPGNDDSGTMSAWLVFTSLGFFPLAGTDTYLLGSPIVTRAELTLQGGVFIVDAPDSSEPSYIVERAAIDGRELSDSSLLHADFVGGSTLTFEMRAEQPVP